MATQTEVKDKINSTLSINKITKAMKLVSIFKSISSVKKLQEYQSFYDNLRDVFHNIYYKNSEVNHDLKKFKSTTWLVINSDLGLAGGYNSNIIKLAKSEIKANDKVYIIGNKGKALMHQLDKSNRVELSLYSEFAKSKDIFLTFKEIIFYAVNNNRNVKVIYSKFISQLDIKATSMQVWPITFNERKMGENERNNLRNISFEPSKREILDEINNIYISSIINLVRFQTSASEHTSRRIAMENASTNGEAMLDDLKIYYNRTRQSKITQEISEIVGGSESL